MAKRKEASRIDKALRRFEKSQEGNRKERQKKEEAGLPRELERELSGIFRSGRVRRRR